MHSPDPSQHDSRAPGEDRPPAPGPATDADTPASRRVPRKALVLTGLALLVGLLVAWPGWRKALVPGEQPAASASGASGASKAPPVPVHTAQVLKMDVPQVLMGVGNVRPIASVTVRSRVDGQLDRVEFKEGQDVQAGQVLARLDPRTFQATLQQAEATLARDQAQLANARTDLQRYTDLVKEDAATRQQLDTQAALVRQLSATVQSDTAQVNAARVQLGYTTIAAPISGRIGARLVDPGNIVHVTDANGLLVINQIDPISVQFTLPESAFQSINQALRGGAPLKVQAIDRESREVLADGQLTLLNNQIDSNTGTVVMKAQFPNAQHKLWPGQSVDTRLVLGTQAGALTVPQAAVQRGQKGLYTYVVGADNTVRLQNIEASDSEGGLAVVRTGLAEGERVVTDGQYRLTPGARVSEPPAKEGAAAGAPSGQPGGQTAGKTEAQPGAATGGNGAPAKGRP